MRGAGRASIVLTGYGVVGLCLLPAAAPAASAFDCSGVTAAGGETVRAQLVTSALSRPVDVQAAPGDVGRLFVVEQTGRIRILQLPGDTLLTTAFLDLTDRVLYGGERGLLGLAFHPRYFEEGNGYFFVFYTRQTDGDLVVARYQTSPPTADTASRTTEKILLTIDHSTYGNHNGGQLAFGPLDGFLYVSTGDGGSGGDPFNSGQTGSALLGKILRLDVDSGDPYGIPSGNPFAAAADGIRDEVWVLGLRNPWRFTFDAANGDLYIADVGQDAWEEIDYLPAGQGGGQNFEWRVREGDHTFSSTTYGAGTPTEPIFEYPHSGAEISGRSVTGGILYRGCRMPELHGTYFFADHRSNWVRSFRVEGGRAVGVRNRTDELNAGILPDLLDGISAFGVDARGEMYICDLDTKLFRVVPADTGTPVKTFRRGDANGDGSLDVSDPVSILFHLFLAPPAPPACRDALDSNDDGQPDLSDALFLLEGLFREGPAPPAPYPACGVDATADSTDCQESTCA